MVPSTELHHHGQRIFWICILELSMPFPSMTMFSLSMSGMKWLLPLTRPMLELTSKLLHETPKPICTCHIVSSWSISHSNSISASQKSSALVGYAAIDGTSDWRNPLASYLSCDVSSSNSGATAIDIYGLNN